MNREAEVTTKKSPQHASALYSGSNIQQYVCHTQDPYRVLLGCLRPSFPFCNIASKLSLRIPIYICQQSSIVWDASMAESVHGQLTSTLLSIGAARAPGHL